MGHERQSATSVSDTNSIQKKQTNLYRNLKMTIYL